MGGRALKSRYPRTYARQTTRVKPDAVQRCSRRGHLFRGGIDPCVEHWCDVMPETPFDEFQCLEF
jgi:hypothetical protein